MLSLPNKLFKNSSSTSPNKYHDTTPRDRISELPDEVLELILKNLTLRDAVRTTLLSHRWKHITSILSNLFFHMQNLLQPCAETWKENAERFVTGVNQFLDSYPGTHIISFRVFFRLSPNFNGDIDRWVEFAFRMGVEDLYLNLWCSKVTQPPNARKYVLSGDVFDGAKINLKKLCLIGCILGPNLFTSQLSSLETLVLDCITLVEHDIQSMFSCLANLKFLKFQRCILPEKLCLGSLHLLGYFYVLKCSGINSIELSNPNLIRLDCVCPHFVKLSMDDVPKLEYYRHAHVTGKQLHSIFSYYPQLLPHLKTLFVSTESVWHEHTPKSLTTFSSVTKLELFFFGHTKFNILKMVSILKAFPSLHTLYFKISCAEDLNRSSSLRLGNYLHKSLEDVTFGGFNETPMQIKFAIYLLNHATSLKRLVITKKGENQAWDTSERQKVYEELQKFSKDTLLIVQ